MTFTDAIRTCFRKYATFAGRASRPEYWWFFLFLVLGSIVAGILDASLFGTASVESTLDTGDGFSAGFSADNDGPLGFVFAIVTLLPALAAGWRRMHDTGRSGLHLLYPLIVMVGLGSFAAMTGFSGGIEAGADGAITPLQGFAGIVLLIGGIVFLVSPLIVLWWLTRPSQPGENQYGPNPHEVPL